MNTKLDKPRLALAESLVKPIGSNVGQLAHLVAFFVVTFLAGITGVFVVVVVYLNDEHSMWFESTSLSLADALNFSW